MTARHAAPPGPATEARFRPEAYRDAALVGALAERAGTLAREIGRPVRLMHICGTHEHEILRYGLRDLLPPGVEVLAGPGCPVCVCDSGLIDQAIRLALTPGVILTSFGDMLAVPGSIPSRGGPHAQRDGGPDGLPRGDQGADRRGRRSAARQQVGAGSAHAPGRREARGDLRMSLLDARARGGDVRTVYSVFDAARLARAEPGRGVVFFSVGFETTVVATAALLRRGAPPNFIIVEAIYYTPPATTLLPTLPGFDVEGFLLPGHASAVTGVEVYRHLPETGLACAVAGFEPADILAGVADLLVQIRDGRPRVDNVYGRVVEDAGNRRALAELDQVFELATRRWRGIGDIPRSGYALRPAYRSRAAVARFPEALEAGPERASELPAGCRCAEVTLGLERPVACPLFERRCTPESPYGPCMVSHEGTCRAWYQYGVGRTPAPGALGRAEAGA